MEPNDYWKSTRGQVQERKRVAFEAGTTVAYLKVVFGGHQKPGSEMAMRIERATRAKVCRHDWGLPEFPAHECGPGTCGTEAREPVTARDV